MADSGFEAFDRFIREMRRHIETTDDGPERWQAATRIFRRLLTDRLFRAAALDWPTSDGSLVLYEDGDYGFALDALVKEPGAEIRPHHHGNTYVIYGSLHGNEYVNRLELDDGLIRVTKVTEFFSGDMDLLLPGEAHAQQNKSAKTVALELRSSVPAGDVVRTPFHLKTGEAG